MNSSIWFVFAVLAIALVQSERLGVGPQTFADKTQAEQKPQKRETKEIEVYLTPSQIKALQEGGGFLNAEPDEEAEASQENEEETEQEQEEQLEKDDFQLGSLQLDSQLEQEENQVPSSIPVEEPTSEEGEPQFSWIYRPPQDKTVVPLPEDNYAYLRYYPESETENVQPELEENEEESEEEAEPVVQQQRFKLVPYDSATEKSDRSTTEAPKEDPIRESWLRLLEQNRAQLRKMQAKVAAATSTTTEQPQAEPETTLAKLQFFGRYNDQKQAIKNEEQRSKEILEKQKAFISVEARANNAPSVVRKEVKTKQAPLIKHVKVHTPVLVPIPQPFEVKVPHPFPVPLDIFRSIATKATKAKKADTKKSSAGARVEEKPKAPKKLSTTTEKPPAERLAPAKPAPVDVFSRQRSKPERLTIIRHVFEN